MGPLSRASVAIAAEPPAPARGPSCRCAGPNGSQPCRKPTWEPGGLCQTAPPTPRAPNCIQRRSLARGAGGQGRVLRRSGTAVTLGFGPALGSFSPNQTYLGGQGPNLENSRLKDKGLEND